ncbi:MAG TPA: ORF6N domain-containing protein [Candidatus Aphodocola excrementigallinarum]|uniref:ORF6N domain-containing protein n=1 Tax=Candidatus Aphodocola excrementigallinarum TaxID=2840670 RepID=A0A9D1IPF6_9FIRM|nr:ORF6N domain-containing protein [Candidatus Aphodocola excrementigallinarum]
MNELKEQANIRNLIYEVRGKQVMLDSDLAFLYGCTNGTKDINKAVKRNIERFPSNFYFQLTKEEFQNLKFQIGTSNIKEHGGIRKLPYVFTEQGVAMLSSVLRTKNAAKVSVNIMNAFVYMRRFINENKDIFKRVIEIENKTDYIESTLKEYDKNFEVIFGKFDRKEDLKSKLFFDGEIYDAYSLLVDIISKASKEIIIIDNYVDKVTLDILSKKKVNVMVLLITDENKSKLTKTDINKFNNEYPLLKIKYTNTFHDRFIIIDNKELYHLGASLKDLGKKVFGINKIEDISVLNQILKKVNVISNICIIR